MAVTTDLSLKYGFSPIVGKNAQTLILGSMPGMKSLQEHQYYAHPRNAFWPIMANLLNFDNTINYSSKVQQLIHHHISVWDVLNSCVRPGSLDHHIDDKTSIPNHFNLFFQQNPHIKLIVFNGGKAEQIFVSAILPELKENFCLIPRLRMPSTSPAHASISFVQKQQKWLQALTHHRTIYPDIERD